MTGGLLSDCSAETTADCAAAAEVVPRLNDWLCCSALGEGDTDDAEEREREVCLCVRRC